jgi:hypothetical protein
MLNSTHEEAAIFTTYMVPSQLLLPWCIITDWLTVCVTLNDFGLVSVSAKLKHLDAIFYFF